jgi:hypothetical protein
MRIKLTKQAYFAFTCELKPKKRHKVIDYWTLADIIKTVIFFG